MSVGVEGVVSVKASALILRELVKRTGNDRIDAVISVPAFFSDQQRRAVRQSAELAQINCIRLINEPTAAAIRYNSNRHTLTVVYDLGGGTFDISIVDSRFGDYQVRATGGIVVGGDNLDEGIYNYVLNVADIKRHRHTKEELKLLRLKCEDYKLQVQQTRQAVTIDLRQYHCKDDEIQITPQTYDNIQRTVFKDTLTKTREVLARYDLSGQEFTLLFVGGSTSCPYLREWIMGELKVTSVEFGTYNPNTLVAAGASLFADMIADGTADEKVTDISRAISVGLSNNMCQVLVRQDTVLPHVCDRHFTIPACVDQVIVDILQGDNLLVPENDYIGTLLYDVKNPNDDKAQSIYLRVSIDTEGVISVSAREAFADWQTVKLRREGI
jgi:molecular chaperone DnaK (HSP70)